VVEKGKE
jgi:hypothetical protein